MKSKERQTVAIESGARIRALRESKGYIRETFGKMIGIEPRALGNYETGLRQLPPQDAIKICGLFGVTLDWIYRGNAAGMPASLIKELEERKQASA